MIPSPKSSKMVGVIGAGSVGKTSLVYQLTGRLRTHGVLAEAVVDPAASLPFPPTHFDTYWTAFVCFMARKLERECEVALRPNVELLLSDRTPLDIVAYIRAKHPTCPILPELEALALSWAGFYDKLYLFPIENLEYRPDGFRGEETSWHRDVDTYLLTLAERPATKHLFRVVRGTHRQRAEYVYHDLLAHVTGERKAMRVIAQVRAWLDAKYGSSIADIRMHGSRSVARFHAPASDKDDYDILVVVHGIPETAMTIYREVQQALPYLEVSAEATLDIKVVCKGMEPHEV